MSLTEAAMRHVEASGADVKIWQRYSPAPGRIVVVRDKTPEQNGDFVSSYVPGPGGTMVAILGTDNEKNWRQSFEPWATVLMIGAPRQTEYGTTIQPPGIKEGDRIMINATGGRDVAIEADGVSMTLCVIPYEGVILVDHGKTP